MNYKVPGPTEFGQRMRAILRTTWASWQIERERECSCDSADIAMHEQHECAFPPALLISQSRVEHAE